jgi:succinate-semialdehyde dehydrogenase/glutarate-semialdehyde dehydrogenase
VTAVEASAAREHAIHVYPEVAHYIGGEWRTTGDGRTIPVVDPATERVIAQLPLASPSDIDAAIAAAHDAFPAWRGAAPAARAEIMQRAADWLVDRRDDMAAIIALELGKPVAQALVEVDVAVGHLRWSAEEGRRTYGRVIPAAAGRQQVAMREPIGPVAAFAPWNAPLITPSRKVAYALAAGCTVVMKPAEETPGAALCLVRALAESGMPPGVVNVVLGDPATISRHLLDDDRIRAMTFTGSVEVGRQLATQASARLKPAVMELGGNAPVIVCSDAAGDKLAASAAQAAYRNSGQVCTSPTRFFIERSSYASFVEQFATHVGGLRVGDPFDATTDVGPLATDRRLLVLPELIDDAVKHGARLVTGGRRRGESGYYWEPTLLADVPAEARLSTTEPFGPIATVAPFDTLDDAVALANQVSVGLAGYVFTDRASAQASLIAGIDCGSLAVNNWTVSGAETPFGGHRNSGFGSEGGPEGIAAFQQTKFVSIQ